MDHRATHPGLTDPLLDEPPGAEEGATKKPRRGFARSCVSAAARAARMSPGEMVSAGAALAGRRRRVSAVVLAVLLVGGGLWVWLAVRIQPPPDYAHDSLDTLFEYTLLTDDFNRLPLEERIALIEQLVERLRKIGSGDSVLLAMFASMISGEARAQLEENISRLAIDVSDKYAASYDPNAPQQEREAYLRDAYLGMVSMFDFADGEVGEHTPEELLEEGRRQARRDLNRFKKGKVGAAEVVRVFDLMNNKVGKHMSGHQKIRVSAMFRDMTEMLRSGP